MKILRRAGVAAGVAAFLCFGSSFSVAGPASNSDWPASVSVPARGSTSPRPVRAAQATAPNPTPASAPVSAPAASTKRPPGTGPAHVYLLRGLLNIFSLGMDDLAQKLERAGYAATVHEHSEWARLADEIGAKYKAGNHGPIVLIGHSLGADAVMLLGERLGSMGVPVALIVPFDATKSFAASGNVARVMNITQRDYAYMRRGSGFRGELANVDVSNDESIGHISIDKTPRLHTMVVNKVAAVVGKGGQLAAPVASTLPASSKPVSGPAEAGAPKPEPATASVKLEHPITPSAAVATPAAPTPPSPPAIADSVVGAALAVRAAAAPKRPVTNAPMPLEYQRLAP